MSIRFIVEWRNEEGNKFNVTVQDPKRAFLIAKSKLSVGYLNVLVKLEQTDGRIA